MEPVLQLALFDGASREAVREETPKPSVLPAALDDLAFLYTGTEKGNNSGIRFAMTRSDAMAWCGSDISRGVLHGTAWAYFWTSARNFIDCHWGLHKPKLDIRKLIDNGQWDARIASLGLRKIGFSQFREVFEPMGVEVIQ